MISKLDLSSPKPKSTIQISGSKSESNRWLLLQSQFPELQIKNLSDSDDTRLMKQGLASDKKVIDIGHAGTAMRFLTAYFANQSGREILLTGSDRMKLRPIQVLVKALNSLGADIQYKDKKGYPPLVIRGRKLLGGKVSIDADVSSQYLSALLLISAKLDKGLEMELKGKLTSKPYVLMSLGLMQKIGIRSSFDDNIIRVSPVIDQPSFKSLHTVESDWSSASYFYSICALSPIGTSIQLSSFRKDSLQGDRILSEIYRDYFGVETQFQKDSSICLTKVKKATSPVYLNLIETPDIAQTITVTCLGLGLSCQLQGLHTLKIKETDRLQALKNESEKLGAQLMISKDALQLASCKKLNKNTRISTYNDHRMAMSFAPLALRVPIEITDPLVVSKSYLNYWEDLKKIGLNTYFV